MTNNEFRNILNDEENLLSKEELDLLINAELAKPEEEMDTKLIDYCLKALQAFNNDDKKERDGEKTCINEDNCNCRRSRSYNCGSSVGFDGNAQDEC